MRIRSWVMGMALAGLLVSLASAAGVEKKLVQYGWDIKCPAYVAEHIREMERKPFDGTMTRTDPNGFSHVFWNKKLNEAETAGYLKAMASIKWKKFTDNFFMTYARSNMDWFSEEDWGPDGWVLRNAKLCGKAARVGRCVGICFDPEAFWGPEPWNYGKQIHRKEKTVAEYRAIVRKRGRQFIDAIESEMPNPVFLTFFWGVRYAPVAKIAEATDPKMVDKIVAEASSYGLLHDFMLGILEGADKGTTIVDGNESAYWNSTPERFLRDYHFIRQTMLGAIPEELRDKFRAQVQVGQAIYADVHMNTRLSGQHTYATYMTPEERARMMEYIVYLALKHSDRYVWFYTELPSYFDDRYVEPGMIPAIARARRKISRNEELGFDMKSILARVSKAYNQRQWGSFEPLKAEIARAVARPKIDGKLDDEVWKNASKLGPFVNFRTAATSLETKTTAYMAYDETNLYIGVRCDDPATDKLSVDNIQNTEGEVIGAGNLVQVAIGADAQSSKYYYITIAYDNQRWDALTPRGDYPNEINGKNSSWDGKYEHATHVDKSFWSLEMAIPWATLRKQAPKPGDEIKGNIRLGAGYRESHGRREYSSWSPMVMPRNMEAKNFGTWVFK